jgi:lipoprotein-anchoring transpeptidase ErfK/SrfK
MTFGSAELVRNHREPAAPAAVRRGPAILGLAAGVVLLIAALGGTGVINVSSDGGGASSGSNNPAVVAATTPASGGAGVDAGQGAPPDAAGVDGDETPGVATTTGAANLGTLGATPAGGQSGSEGVTTLAAPDGFALAIGTFFDAYAEPAEDAPLTTPVTPAPGITATPNPSATSAASPADSTALPANSGTGRRAVYAITAQRVWLVEADGRVSRTYRVSGRLDRPGPGTYAVYSKSATAVSYNYTERMQYMIRFAHGQQAAIGFHDIPVDQAGHPVQTEAQLGQPLSAGCVRQAEADAVALWNWAPVGTTVVVLP